MKTTAFSATFDGERIRLEDDLVLPKNARLLVTLLPDEAADEASFRSFWQQLSAQSLARAYGSDEPDYPDSCIKERNPAYEERGLDRHLIAASRRRAQKPARACALRDASLR